MLMAFEWLERICNYTLYTGKFGQLDKWADFGQTEILHMLSFNTNLFSFAKHFSLQSRITVNSWKVPPTKLSCYVTDATEAT